MSEKILKLFMRKGFLLDKEMLDFFSQLSDETVAEEILDKLKSASKGKVITKNVIENNMAQIQPVFKELDTDKKKIVERFLVNVSVSLEVKKEVSVEDSSKEDESDSGEGVRVLSSPVIPDRKLEVKDFVKHFRSRYNFFKKLLQDKKELEGLISIDKISGNRDFSLIGMVVDKRVTKNKNVFLEIEDLTGKAKVLITHNKEEIFEKAKEILLDDVIGLKISGSRDFLFVNDLFYPDCYLDKKKKLDDESYALFASDWHVGSKNFLESGMNRFIDFLNGVGCDDNQKEIIKKIRYLFVVGDSVDGVGAYPGQEKDLEIKDVKKQYEKLAEFYRKIPKHINIIQCAGQHDAVRVAIPQPPVGEDFAKPLHELENLYLVSNPSMVEIGGGKKEGIKVLMYHGAGIIPHIIHEIEELRLSNAQATPAKAVKHLLLRRHLAPCHGGFVYIPNMDEDSMLIKEIPDIITTGDMHKADVDMYNNILIVCNSCWQSQTAYEEKVGNQPDYCKVPMLNLKTRELKILDFYEDDGNN